MSTKPLSDLLADLDWRGLVQQCSDEELGPWLRAQPRTVYCGFDPTASSLHVGSLLQIMTLRRFQDAGHRPIALVGGATGMIGDPSGKSAERNLLSQEALAENVAGLRAQMARFLDFERPDGARLVDNYEWMKDFGYLTFLRDVGKHFPVNVMLAKESVKSRLGRDDSGMSYTEFSYMLLQAYDFVVLWEQHGCELQFGGSDQWGNITAGIDLGRRMKGAELRGLTGPLLTKADGSKMGKTEQGAIWLDADRTSPYQFYQYWINVADEDAGNCLRMLTLLPREEIAALDHSRAEEPAQRQSQIRLAEWLTAFVHGNEALSTAQRATEIFFGAEIQDLSDTQLLEVFADVPSCKLARERLARGISLIDALAESGLAKSKGEARRTIQQGGAYCNNRRETDLERTLTPTDLASESVMVLRSGKKRYALLRFME